MADQAREELVKKFKSLLVSGDCSDFVITCGSDTYNVHKGVVCAQSGFFKGAERFAARQNATSTKADLSEDEPAIVKLLVQYLYEGGYDVKIADITPAAEPSSSPTVKAHEAPHYRYAFPHTCLPGGCPDSDYMVCHHHQCGDTCNETCVSFVCHKCRPNGVSPTTSNPDAWQLLLNAKMYEIGDKYDVLGLKQLALARFSLACTEHWDSEQFAPAVRYVFSTTPESDKGLRDMVAKTIADHMELLTSPAVKALLNEVNSIAVGLLKMRTEELRWTPLGNLLRLIETQEKRAPS